MLEVVARVVIVVREVSSLLRAWGSLACFDLAFAQPIILSSRKAMASTCTKFWPFVGSIERRKNFGEYIEEISRGVSQFRKNVGFPFFAPSPYLSRLCSWPTNFWRLVTLLEGFPRCRHMWTKVRQFWERGFFRFCIYIAVSLRNAHFFHRAMPQISGVGR